MVESVINQQRNLLFRGEISINVEHALAINFAGTALDTVSGTARELFAPHGYSVFPEKRQNTAQFPLFFRFTAHFRGTL